MQFDSHGRKTIFYDAADCRTVRVSFLSEMNTNAIPQKYLVADVIIVGLYGPIRTLFRTHVCQAPTNYLTANFVALVLLSLSVALSVIGARTPEYRVRWMIFGVACMLGFILIGGVNAVGALISLAQLLI